MKVTNLKVCKCMYLAAAACVAFWTGATEGLEGIMTGAPIEAGLGVTLIDFILTVGAGEARAAGTGVAIDFIRARPSIEARAVNIKNIDLNHFPPILYLNICLCSRIMENDMRYLDNSILTFQCNRGCRFHSGCQ